MVLRDSSSEFSMSVCALLEAAYHRFKLGEHVSDVVNVNKDTSGSIRDRMRICICALKT